MYFDCEDSTDCWMAASDVCSDLWMLVASCTGCASLTCCGWNCGSCSHVSSSALAKAMAGRTGSRGSSALDEEDGVGLGGVKPGEGPGQGRGRGRGGHRGGGKGSGIGGMAALWGFAASFGGDEDRVGSRGGGSRSGMGTSSSSRPASTAFSVSDHYSEAAKLANVSDPAVLTPHLVSDRALLMRFYRETAGDSWRVNKNWGNLVVPLSTWHGVTVDDDDAEKVAALDLTDNGIHGYLPPYFRFLTHLRELHLGRNQLRGSIPPEWGDTKFTPPQTKAQIRAAAAAADKELIAGRNRSRAKATECNKDKSKATDAPAGGGEQEPGCCMGAAECLCSCCCCCFYSCFFKPKGAAVTGTGAGAGAGGFSSDDNSMTSVTTDERQQHVNGHAVTFGSPDRAHASKALGAHQTLAAAKASAAASAVCMINLRSIDLSFNKLSGQLPEAWGASDQDAYDRAEKWAQWEQRIPCLPLLARLTVLLTCGLLCNQLAARNHTVVSVGKSSIYSDDGTSGVAQSVAGGLQFLRWMDVQGNRLTGGIPRNWGRGLHRLRRLKLAGNAMNETYSTARQKLPKCICIEV